MIRSDVAPCRRRSAIGGNPENIYSLQAFRIVTQRGLGALSLATVVDTGFRLSHLFAPSPRNSFPQGGPRLLKILRRSLPNWGWGYGPPGEGPFPTIVLLHG